VRPTDYTRYRLTLPRVGTGGFTTGFMYYCCWRCVCDTQDFIRIDTRNVTGRDGISQRRHFAVIGNPCERPASLEVLCGSRDDDSVENCEGGPVYGRFDIGGGHDVGPRVCHHQYVL